MWVVVWSAPPVLLECGTSDPHCVVCVRCCAVTNQASGDNGSQAARAECGRLPRVRPRGRRGVPRAVRRMRPAVPHGVPRGLRLLPPEAQEQFQPQARGARRRLVLQVLRRPSACRWYVTQTHPLVCGGDRQTCGCLCGGCFSCCMSLRVALTGNKGPVSSVFAWGDNEDGQVAVVRRYMQGNRPDKDVFDTHM